MDLLYLSGGDVADEKIVNLNVGGSRFSATTTTLRERDPTSFLARLAVGNILSAVDASGALWIDRDPVHFRTILNWLRIGDPLILSRAEDGDRTLRAELDFYGLDGAIKVLDELWVDVLSAAEARRQAMIAEARVRHISQNGLDYVWAALGKSRIVKCLPCCNTSRHGSDEEEPVYGEANWAAKDGTMVFRCSMCFSKPSGYGRST